MTSCDVDRKSKAVVAPLRLQMDLLIDLVKELSERNASHSSEGNSSYDRSTSSGQRLDNAFGSFQNININVSINLPKVKQPIRSNYFLLDRMFPKNLKNSKF